MRSTASAFASGLLFAVGLGLAGMTRPSKILSFLDLAGPWDPSLLLVMIFGIGVFAAAYRPLSRRNATIFGAPLRIPSRGKIDGRLLAGAALFGAGWGLGGLCPGPGLVGAAGSAPNALYFCLAMIAGQYASILWPRPGRADSEKTRTTEVGHAN